MEQKFYVSLPESCKPFYKPFSKSLSENLFKKGFIENGEQWRDQPAQRLVINRRNGFGSMIALGAKTG